jgi:hypothetical protein
VPEAYSTFLEWVNLLSFDLSAVLPLGCIWRTSFYDRLLIVTLLPLSIIFTLAVTKMALRWRCDGPNGAPKGPLYRIFVGRASMLFLTFTWLIFSTTSAVIFQVMHALRYAVCVAC